MTSNRHPFDETAIFVAVPITIGRIGFREHGRRSRLLRIPHGALSVALVLCLVLARARRHIGLAAIVGAYLAGLIVAELSDELELKRDLSPIRALLVPFFFVLTGARFDFASMLEPARSLLGVALTIARDRHEARRLWPRDVGHEPSFGRACGCRDGAAR